MIKVEVKYIDKFGNPTEDSEVSRIFIVSETEHAVILSLETQTKYPETQAYFANGIRFLTQSRHCADIRVEGLPFDDAVVIAEASRYGMFIVFFHNVRQDAPQVYNFPID